MKLLISTVFIINGILGLNSVLGQRSRLPEIGQTPRFSSVTPYRPIQFPGSILQSGVSPSTDRDFQPFAFPSSDQPYSPPFQDPRDDKQPEIPLSTGSRRPQTALSTKRPRRPPPQGSRDRDNNSQIKIANAINEFGFNLYKNFGDRNLLFSPMSISLAMGMVFTGAQGETAKEMSTALGYAAFNLQQNEVSREFKQMMDHIQKISAGYEINTANGIFLQDKANVQPQYLNNLNTYFDATVEKVDFINRGELTRRKINAWVENETKRKITEFFPQQLPQNTILALVSAIYFKGKWLKPFNRDNTRNEVFYNNPGGETIVPMMFQSIKLQNNFDKELEANVLIIPYANSSVEMIIILPQEDNNITETIRKLNSATLDRVLSNTKENQVQLGLPKFNLQEQFSLEKVLQSMGMTKLFSPRQANLSGISNDGNLYVSKVSHKSKLEVNEEGTEVTSVTGVEIVPLSLPQMIKINRPFLFIVRDRQSKVNLFMGYVNQL